MEEEAIGIVTQVVYQTLLTYLEENTPVSTVNKDTHLKLTDKEINQYPYLYITGHGNIRLTENEVISLRSILMNNGWVFTCG